MVQSASNKYPDAATCWKELLPMASPDAGLLAVVERFARENARPAKIVFGTSGWRGEIGSDFTFNNVRIVISAIVEMFKSGDRQVMDALGVKDFEEIKKRGVIVGHDNRLLGHEFSMEALGYLNKEGIKAWYAGEAATPEFSAGIEMLQAACSINLTPSHNPANYAGLKFNPSDGGPAGSEITSKIEEISNRMMHEGAVLPSLKADRVDHVDLTDLYLSFITSRKTLGLEKIRDFMERSDCMVCIDNVHGATRGCAEKILGPNRKIVYLRTEDNVLFGGVAPEPSEKNMEGVERVLRESGAKMKIGVIMDPDGDRIRFSDGSMQISMNYFGAMALHFLYTYKGIRGVVVKSVATSNFVNAIAGMLAIPIRETKVGFKNFRPYLLPSAKERAIAAFEESDGISGYNNTLEKDALFGLLLALEMMAVTGKNLSTYLKELMDEFGHFYPDRSGVAVDPSLVGEPLVRKLAAIKDSYSIGTTTNIGGKKRTVANLITVDGVKVVFDDGSWLMIRPSGTEPKVRFYIEARTIEDKKAIFEAAGRITAEALGM